MEIKGGGETEEERVGRKGGEDNPRWVERGKGIEVRKEKKESWEGGRRGVSVASSRGTMYFISGQVYSDLSHLVHSDNCILNEATGDCDKVPPAYTWRDYR